MKIKGVTQFLLSHADRTPVSFHMPGHKGSAIYRENGYGAFLDRMMECDITEIPGADNLYQAEDIIADTMAKYRNLYGVRESYLLINGSSAGLIAAILTCVPRGGKLIMARNCHKSIFNGLLMAGAEPVYIRPEMIGDYGISGEISVESVREAISENPDASAIILPSPNYYGICSDIKAIADAAHAAGMYLIVDQAHGAHLKFFDAYVSDAGDGGLKAADNLGVDIVIQSTHKTLASYTQSAIVNLCTDRVDKYLFEDKLQLIESTSPSYLLMASLDINADLLEEQGERLTREWEDSLRWFYEEAASVEGLRVMAHPMLDHTKINLDMGAYGIDGLQLEELLNEKDIFPELVTGNIVMCMTGIGNKRCDYERLLDVLKEIAAEHELCQETAAPAVQTLTMKQLEQRAIPAFKESVPLKEAAGRICAASVIPYPPGIPIICPGEVMDEEVLAYCADLRARGEKVMGIDDQGRVLVGK